MILSENKWISLSDATAQPAIADIKKYNTVSLLSKPLSVSWNLLWSHKH
jgi:hypothetical protein